MIDRYIMQLECGVVFDSDMDKYSVANRLTSVCLYLSV